MCVTFCHYTELYIMKIIIFSPLIYLILIYLLNAIYFIKWNKQSYVTHSHTSSVNYLIIVYWKINQMYFVWLIVSKIRNVCVMHVCTTHTFLCYNIVLYGIMLVKGITKKKCMLRVLFSRLRSHNLCGRCGGGGV